VALKSIFSGAAGFCCPISKPFCNRWRMPTHFSSEPDGRRNLTPIFHRRVSPDRPAAHMEDLLHVVQPQYL
jgi:hypothetical protein